MDNPNRNVSELRPRAEEGGRPLAVGTDVLAVEPQAVASVVNRQAQAEVPTESD